MNNFMCPSEIKPGNLFVVQKIGNMYINVKARESRWVVTFAEKLVCIALATERVYDNDIMAIECLTNEGRLLVWTGRHMSENNQVFNDQVFYHKNRNAASYEFTRLVRP